MQSATSSSSNQFEYDGTGAQLFTGFLLALLVLAGLAGTAGVAQWVLGYYDPRFAPIPIGLLNFCLVVLAVAAPFSAQRYRLNHTLSRGVRGGMTGSIITFGLRSWLYYALVVLTLGQLWPWASLRLLEWRINVSAFGSVPFELQGRARQLYPRFLATCVGITMLGVAIFGLSIAAQYPAIVQARETVGKLGHEALIRHLVLVFGRNWVDLTRPRLWQRLAQPAPYCSTVAAPRHAWSRRALPGIGSKSATRLARCFTPGH